MSTADRPTADRPTATYPTADHLARLEREEAAHRERGPFAGWRGRTPTEELPVVTPSQPEQAAPRVTTNAPRNEGPIQDMWRPRRLPAWHPSLMQLAIGAAIVAALLASAKLLALDGIASARQAALRESRHGASVSAPAARTAAPTSKPAWTVHGTDAPYNRTDPTASPLDLPRCTASPSTPLPCLAKVSPDSRHAVILEEDASLTGLDLR